MHVQINYSEFRIVAHRKFLSPCYRISISFALASSVQEISPDIVLSTLEENPSIHDFPEVHEYPVATATHKAVEV